MQSAVFRVSAAASTSAGFSASFAPFTTRMRFCPLGSTKIGATPLDKPSTCFTWAASMPSFLKFSIVAGPNRSLPTRATMNTSAPQSRAATAWFAPFPPNPRLNFCPKMVSPGFGNRSAKVVRSMFALPTTAIRGRLGIVVIQSRDQLDTSPLLPVRNPDVLHLRGMVQVPAAFRLLHIEPVDGAAFIGKHLLQIPHRESLCRCRVSSIRKTPDCIYIVVFGNGLEQLRCGPGHNIDHASRQIAGIENLIEISHNKWVGFRRNHDRSITCGHNRQDQREQTEQRCI